MIVYRIKISSLRQETELKRLLKEKMISSEEQNKFYFFPFCMFSNDFRKDFTRSLTILFTGEFNDNDFKLQSANIVFSTRTNLPLLITGTVEENAINLTYSIPLYAILIMTVFSLTFYLLKHFDGNFENISMLVVGLFIIIYLIKIIRIHFAFIRICRKVEK
ncbi:MAG: hypothetical protein H7X84_05940 [Verrucomicrobia bacterium]|nr:hypothetical protein [Prolixibacteraceae bacterium]